VKVSNPHPVSGTQHIASESIQICLLRRRSAAIIWSLGKYWIHINPAITVAHAVADAIRQGVLIPYVGFQILGGLLAGLTLRLMFQSVDSVIILGSTKKGI